MADVTKRSNVELEYKIIFSTTWRRYWHHEQ